MPLKMSRLESKSQQGVSKAMIETGTAMTGKEDEQEYPISPGVDRCPNLGLSTIDTYATPRKISVPYQRNHRSNRIIKPWGPRVTRSMTASKSGYDSRAGT